MVSAKKEEKYTSPDYDKNGYRISLLNFDNYFQKEKNNAKRDQFINNTTSKTIHVRYDELKRKVLIIKNIYENERNIFNNLSENLVKTDTNDLDIEKVKLLDLLLLSNFYKHILTYRELKDILIQKQSLFSLPFQKYTPPTQDRLDTFKSILEDPSKTIQKKVMECNDFEKTIKKNIIMH